MPNTEWYKKTEPDYDASGRWWADGYNEALSLGLSYGDDGVDVNFIDQLLAHHREMIVRRVREQVEEQIKIWENVGAALYAHSMEKSVLADSHIDAFLTVLSLPCLKENE